MKLFGKGGKLNIIDLILIFALLAVIVFVFVAPKMAADNGNSLGDAPPTGEAHEIVFIVACEDIDEMLANSIIDSLSGDGSIFGNKDICMTQLYNNHKLVDGNVTAWEYTDGTLYLTIEGMGLYDNGAFAVGSQEVRIGRSYTVKTLGIEIAGVIFTLENGK